MSENSPRHWLDGSDKKFSGKRNPASRPKGSPKNKIQGIKLQNFQLKNIPPIGQPTPLKGFFWPTLQADASEYTKKYEQCQMFATVPKQPPKKMNSILSPIPFAMWVVDIVEILPTSTKQAKYCIISIDYMTKWVKARPLSVIIEEATKNFFLEQIILRFLHHFGVQQKFSSVAYLQGDGVGSEQNNLSSKKKRLGESKGRWAEELPWVLWAYRTTPRSSTGETSFRLAYETEALVLVEVGLESYRTEVYNVENNNFGLRANIDLLEEEKEVAHQRNMKYLLQEAQHYDSEIKKGSLGIGDLVLRN
ncbi:uncharacterized protein LOC141691702 [Apium graveolens]|uniref:uncharacterized protein LOC141691702 n=1 Tax=Apium graveolens TaxID=4045 RepID=UPI003D797F23